MLMRIKAFAWVGLLANLTGADTVHSAGASASAAATIVAPVSTSASITTAFTQTLFSTSTGVLTIRIPGAPMKIMSVEYSCGMTNSLAKACNAPTTLQVVNDGTLNGSHGISISLTQGDGNSPDAVMAMLNYN